MELDFKKPRNIGAVIVIAVVIVYLGRSCGLWVF